MSENRVFVSQETLDRWLSEERVEVQGDVLTLLENGQSFRLTTALHFTSEVAGGGDPQGFLGKVKPLSVVLESGGEHCAGSVVQGESAYEVVEGFLGALMNGATSSVGSPQAWPPRDDLEHLARFFASSP